MTSPLRILIVEDEPLLRLSITAYLEDSGFECLEAGDGIEGLEAFHQGHPDLVLTDLRMPRLDGMGVIAALQSISPETPIVVLTGTGDAWDLEQARRLGARACLLKPLHNMEILVETLKGILAEGRDAGGMHARA